nr:MAG TPA: hypothetical protein [Caudoviricetes sp.]
MNLILSSLVARSSTTFEDFLLTDFVASEDSNLSRLTDLLDLPRLAYKKRQRKAPHFSPMALYLSAVRIAVLFSMHKFISCPIPSLKKSEIKIDTWKSVIF